MNASLHQHSTDEKIAFRVTHNDGSAWLTITDPGGNYLTLFFEPAAIADIMAGMESALGEMETIAAHLDRDSDGELAPAGHSEQDGVLVASLADDGTGIRVSFGGRS